MQDSCHVVHILQVGVCFWCGCVCFFGVWECVCVCVNSVLCFQDLHIDVHNFSSAFVK